MSPTLSRQFIREVAKSIKESAREFGHKASNHYEKLIATALEDIANNPLLHGSREFEQVRLYHIKHSKQAAAVDGIIVKTPRHILAYQVQDKKVLYLESSHFSNERGQGRATLLSPLTVTRWATGVSPFLDHTTSNGSVR